jgi:prepilin-type N-terminal cleavage/methylation domain-containing protein
MTSQEGFTLIETLCAFAILALVLTAFYAASGTALQGLRAAEDRSLVVLLARSKLDELKAVRGPIPRSEQGDFPGTAVVWRVETFRIGAENPAAHVALQDVRLQLRWPGRNGEQTLVLTTRHMAVMPP